MSKQSWAMRLRQTLQQSAKADQPPRVAVLGIGHELNGDDAAGLAVVRSLTLQQDRLLLIVAGPAPENQTGALRAFDPDLVLLIDAAQMGAEPGTVRLLDWQATTGISASTHTMPLHMLAKFLTLDLGCDVALLGIQPFANAIDAPLSLEMQAVVGDVVRELTAALRAD